MIVNRETILRELSAYLNNELSKQEVYEWALSVAVTDHFQELARGDVLIRRTIQAMIDINHDDLKFIPTRKALEYYRRCLVGEEKFVPLEINKDLKNLNIPDDPDIVNRKKKPKYFIFFRIYIIIFSICSLTIHIASMIDPAFFNLDQTSPTRLAVIKESFPHVFYALFVLIPVRYLVRWVLFYPSFVFLSLGMLYYWYISFQMVLKLSLNMVFIFMILPLTAIPATLALFLLMMGREEFKENRKSV